MAGIQNVQVAVQGRGLIDGQGRYKFMITALDGEKNASSDKLRIKITDMNEVTV